MTHDPHAACRIRVPVLTLALAGVLALAACGGAEGTDELLSAAGSREQAQAKRVRALDAQAPTVAISSTSAIGVNGAVSLSGTATDDTRVQSVTWANDRGGSGSAVLSGSSTSATWSAASIALQTGSNTITVTATDGAGNQSQASTVVSRSDGASAPPPVSGSYPMAPALTLSNLSGSLVTFEMPWNDVAASPISPAWRNAKPAGALGPITVLNGHFAAGGARLRLYGINISLGALTPTHAEADAMAANLAKQGFNAVRIHGFDRPYIGRTYKQQGILNNDWTSFNPTALDLFDYLIAKLVQNGLYVKFMAHSDRIYPDSPDCIERCEGLDNYLPALVKSQKDFLAGFLSHVNPYTGRSYAAEPGVFAVEINNEDALTHRWQNGTIDQYVQDPVLGPKYGAPLQTQWSTWLTKKYGTASTLSAAWGKPVADLAGVPVPLHADAGSLGTAVLTDWWKFVAATEETYWSGLYDHIKLTLGFKGLVSGGQMNYSPSFFKPKSDFTDRHYYWHPNPAMAGTWSNPGAPNDGYPILATDSNAPQYVDSDPKNAFYGSMNRVKGKPHIVSEYSQRSHNIYAGEAEVMMIAYALFQDWDGVFLFTYSDQNLVAPEKKQGFLYNDALKKIARAAAVTMFKRGDVAAGANEKVYAISQEGTFNQLIKDAAYENQFAVGANIREGLRSRISHTIVDTVAQELVPASSTFSGSDYWNDNNQILWSAGSAFSIFTPKSQVRSGALDGKLLALGTGVTVELGRTMQGRSTVTLSTLSDTDNLPTATSMLLTLTGADQPEYFWSSADNLRYVVGIGRNRLEVVPARITLTKTTGKSLRVFAMDDTGNVKLEVPVTDGGSSWSFVVGPGTDSPWYLLQQQ